MVRLATIKYRITRRNLISMRNRVPIYILLWPRNGPKTRDIFSDITEGKIRGTRLVKCSANETPNASIKQVFPRRTSFPYRQLLNTRNESGPMVSVETRS